MTTHIRLSVRMQEIAAQVNQLLSEAAGQEVAWVLVCTTEGVSQYVSNTTRSDGAEMIEHLLARWKANRADIPAHYNPDLMGQKR
jgi:hypothetical protein